MGKGIQVSIQVKEKFMYAYMTNGRGDCGLYKAVVQIFDILVVRIFDVLSDIIRI